MAWNNFRFHYVMLSCILLILMIEDAKCQLGGLRFCCYAMLSRKLCCQGFDCLQCHGLTLKKFPSIKTCEERNSIVDSRKFEMATDSTAGETLEKFERSCCWIDIGDGVCRDLSCNGCMQGSLLYTIYSSKRECYLEHIRETHSEKLQAVQAIGQNKRVGNTKQFDPLRKVQELIDANCCFTIFNNYQCTPLDCPECLTLNDGSPIFMSLEECQTNNLTDEPTSQKSLTSDGGSLTTRLNEPPTASTSLESTDLLTTPQIDAPFKQYPESPSHHLDANLVPQNIYDDFEQNGSKTQGGWDWKLHDPLKEETNKQFHPLPPDQRRSIPTEMLPSSSDTNKEYDNAQWDNYPESYPDGYDDLDPFGNVYDLPNNPENASFPKDDRRDKLEQPLDRAHIGLGPTDQSGFSIAQTKNVGPVALSGLPLNNFTTKILSSQYDFDDYQDGGDFSNGSDKSIVPYTNFQDQATEPVVAVKIKSQAKLIQSRNEHLSTGQLNNKTFASDGSAFPPGPPSTRAELLSTNLHPSGGEFDIYQDGPHDYLIPSENAGLPQNKFLHQKKESDPLDQTINKQSGHSKFRGHDDTNNSKLSTKSFLSTNRVNRHSPDLDVYEADADYADSNGFPNTAKGQIELPHFNNIRNKTFEKAHSHFLPGAPPTQTFPDTILNALSKMEEPIPKGGLPDLIDIPSSQVDDFFGERRKAPAPPPPPHIGLPSPLLPTKFISKPVQVPEKLGGLSGPKKQETNSQKFVDKNLLTPKSLAGEIKPHRSATSKSNNVLETFVVSNAQQPFSQKPPLNEIIIGGTGTLAVGGGGTGSVGPVNRQTHAWHLQPSRSLPTDSQLPTSTQQNEFPSPKSQKRDSLDPNNAGFPIAIKPHGNELSAQNQLRAINPNGNTIGVTRVHAVPMVNKIPERLNPEIHVISANQVKLKSADIISVVPVRQSNVGGLTLLDSKEINKPNARATLVSLGHQGKEDGGTLPSQWYPDSQFKNSETTIKSILKCDGVGYCWCEDSQGNVQHDTLAGPGQKVPQCGIPLNEFYTCERQPRRISCTDTSNRVQPVIRWYRRGSKCSYYFFSYCKGDYYTPPFPLKRKEQCEQMCLNNQTILNLRMLL